MSSILVLGPEMFIPWSVPLLQYQSIIMPGEHRFSIFDSLFVGVSAVNDKVPRLCGDSNIKLVVKIVKLSHDNMWRKCTRALTL